MFNWFKVNRFKVGDKIQKKPKESWHKKGHTITIKQVGNYCYLVGSPDTSKEYEIPFWMQDHYEIAND